MDILIGYFGRTRLGLNRKVISSLLDNLNEVGPSWDKLIGISFLPVEMKREYKSLLESRWERLFGRI